MIWQETQENRQWKQMVQTVECNEEVIVALLV